MAKKPFVIKVEVNEDGIPILKNKVAVKNRIKQGMEFEVVSITEENKTHKNK